MSDWKEYKLGEIINVKHGYAFRGEYFSETPTLDILLTPGNFSIGGGFKQGKLKYYNGDYPISYKLNEGDIIVTMTDLSKEGDTLGYSAKIPKHNEIRYLHNQRIGLLQFTNEDFCKDYIYWVLRSRDYQKFIVNSATGSTVKHTSPSRICEYVFSAPNLPTQTNIAEILSSLDDKIELNNKINQELETLAQTIFKQWFIDFEFPNENGEPYKSSGGEMMDSELGEIPKGWEVKPITNFIEVKDGTHDSPKQCEEGNYLITSKHLKNSFIDFDSAYKISKEDFLNVNKRSKVDKNDILITMIGTVGNLYFIGNEPDYAIKNIGLFKSSTKPNFSIYLYEYLKSSFISEYYSARLAGSTQQYLTLTVLRETPIIYAENVVNKFVEVIKEMRSSIINNSNETQELINLRNTLLPKLISGELEINQITN